MRVESLPAYDDIRTLAERCYHGGTNYAAVAGFLPPADWADLDIKGAYATCMAAIRLPDWGDVRETREPEALADLEVGIGLARVRFRFPDGTRFPCLPVRSGEGGLIFPLEGESWCTGPELRVALDLGAEIVVERGVIVPWKAGSPHPFAEFSKHIARLRKAHPKGSPFELLAKEMGNSLYGKLAQGVYPDGAESRDGGITPGRAAAGKRVFDSRRGTLERVPPSRITQAAFAAFVTGLCRALLAELVARLPAGATLATATTDGFLADVDPARVDTGGPVASHFSRLRVMLDGDPTILEVKHRAREVVVFRTRGTVAVAGDGRPILARAGHRLDDPVDPDEMPGGTPEERQLAALWAEARAWADLYRARDARTTQHRRHVISPRQQWLTDGDLVDVERDVRVALDYDLKRKPERVGERQGCLLVEGTAPWRDRAEFLDWREALALWRERTGRVLKTLADWTDFLAFREALARTGASRRVGRTCRRSPAC